MGTVAPSAAAANVVVSVAAVARHARRCREICGSGVGRVARIVAAGGRRAECGTLLAFLRTGRLRWEQHGASHHHIISAGGVPASARPQGKEEDCMDAKVRRRLDMGARALEFGHAHPLESPGYAATMVRLEERLVRADQLATQQRDGRWRDLSRGRLRRRCGRRRDGCRCWRDESPLGLRGLGGGFVCVECVFSGWGIGLRGLQRRVGRVLLATVSKIKLALAATGARHVQSH